MDYNRGANYNALVNGNVFIAYTAAAGVVPPIYTNTAQTFGIWNQSPNKKVIPIKCTLNCLGTPAVSGHIGMAVVQAGFQIVTGNISAITKSTPLNGLTLLPQEATAGKYLSAATTVAPSVFVPWGFSSAGVLAAAATTVPWTFLRANFDDDWSIAPGMCIFICGNVAQTAAFGITFSWREEPV
jgi:hypothetical protein